MFRRSRKQIVGMVILFLQAWQIVMLSLIYVTTYYRVSADTSSRLKQFTEAYISGNGPMGIPVMDETAAGVQSEEMEKPAQGEQHDLKGMGQGVSNGIVYYMVVLDTSENLIHMLNDIDPVMSDEDLLELSEQLLREGKTSGQVGTLRYLVSSDAEGNHIVTLMDNTILTDSTKTLLRNTVFIGMIMTLVSLCLATIFARAITRPIEENDRKQRQFVSDAGHELKTPIAVIRTSLDMLIREKGQNKWTENIAYENEKMKNLVTDLLDLAQIENQIMERMPVNMSRAILSELLPLESLAFEKGIFIESEMKEDVMLEGIESKLKQLVTILIDNAMEHSQSGSQIRVSLYQKQKSIYFTVENQGEQLAEEEKNHLFDRFYQADTSRSKEGHYGLGLSIAKAIVEMHGGNISVIDQNGWICFQCIFHQNMKKM
ncbi:MAG: HAMP domain-containing sensor histidine kinase [Eubacteriales bacterium]|nr:HAMP domain-containing sensor histidine kinase [Eubacteriales bacterium]